jgi:hypothetical protein
MRVNVNSYSDWKAAMKTPSNGYGKTKCREKSCGRDSKMFKYVGFLLLADGATIDSPVDLYVFLRTCR